MSQKLTLTALIAVAAASVGVALVAAMRPASEVTQSGVAVANRAEDAPAGARVPAPVVLKARKGRVLSVADAVKELDLIRPSRQKLAEDFTLPLVGGDKLRLSAQRGKVVLINFWATWCPPCREEMPTLERLAQARQEAIQVLGVNLDTVNPAKVRAFVRELGISFPILLDPDLGVGKAYRVRGLPTSFVVDRDGVVRFREVGYRDWTDRESQFVIDEALRAR